MAIMTSGTLFLSLTGSGERRIRQSEPRPIATEGMERISPSSKVTCTV